VLRLSDGQISPSAPTTRRRAGRSVDRMMSAISAIDTAAGRPARVVRDLPASPRFEWAVVALSAAIVAGAHLDSWAHGHIAATLETLFTPWHALLYGSLAATTAFLVLSAAWTGARPWWWGRALPDGYALALLGCLLFGVGGVLDLAWHLRFGIERGFQALISPTHLVLMVSSGLIVSGPLRAAWRRPGRSIGWPAIASATLTLTLLTFFGQFDHPFTSQWSAMPQTNLPVEAAEELGMLGIILHTGLLMGVVLLLVRRFDLPPGSLTFLVGVNAVFVTMIKGADPIILVGVLGGVAADMLLAALRPAPDRLAQVRLFGFLVPLMLYALYFYGLIRVDGVWWPVHLWAGAPVVAGLTGLILSLAVLPPPAPAASTAAQGAARPRGTGVGPAARRDA
jgi:hypothetical protein